MIPFKQKILELEQLSAKRDVNMTDEQRDQRGADQSWTDSAGGFKPLPYGQNHLRAAWKLKHIFGLRSVSPISSPTLCKPSGQPATKANQHF